MNKILVVNVNWVGDVIFSSPIFSSLKKAYPQAHVSCLAVPRVEHVLRKIPGVDEIIIYDEKGLHWNPMGKWQIIRTLRKNKFDAVFILHRSFTRALLMMLAGIPVRVGYDEKNRGMFLTHKVPAPQEDIHRSDHYINIIESFGINVDDRRSRLQINGADLTEAKNIFNEHGLSGKEFIVVVNPGGNWDLKRWSPQNYFHLITSLVNQYKAKIILTGAEKDIAITEEISENLSEDVKANIIHLAGKTSLAQLMAIMKTAKFVISADSGPLHMANSLGTDVIGLYGPTHEQATGPRGSGDAHILKKDVGCNRSPCYYLDCPDNICMQSVSVKDVLDVVEQINHP